MLYGYTGLFALGFASRQGLNGSLAAALVSGRSLGTLMGVQTTAIALGTALGPWLGGWAFDHTGSYHLAFALALLSSLGSVVCIWLATPRHGSLARGTP